MVIAFVTPAANFPTKYNLYGISPEISPIEYKNVEAVEYVKAQEK